MVRIIISFLFLIIPFIQGISQSEIQKDPYLKFDHITTKNGLSHNSVLDIYQDLQGYLWIATVEGLNRYDGYHMTNYFSNTEDSTSLSSDFISCIGEDKKGKRY